MSTSSLTTTSVVTNGVPLLIYWLGRYRFDYGEGAGRRIHIACHLIWSHNLPPPPPCLGWALPPIDQEESRERATYLREHIGIINILPVLPVSSGTGLERSHAGAIKPFTLLASEQVECLYGR